MKNIFETRGPSRFSCPSLFWCSTVEFALFCNKGIEMTIRKLKINLSMKNFYDFYLKKVFTIYLSGNHLFILLHKYIYQLIYQ